MKYLKSIREEYKMKIINFKDLKNWSVKDHINPDTRPYVNVKVDEKLARKVINLFESYGIGFEVGSRNYCKDYKIILPNEENLTEYGVRIDMLKDDSEIDDLFEFGEFSVFLPKNKLDGVSLGYAAIVQASKYLENLSNSVSEVYRLKVEDYLEAFSQYPENFGKFLNFIDVKINNENLSLITDVAYRLYKDAKYCFYLKNNFSNVGIGSYENFINDWIKLL